MQNTTSQFGQTFKVVMIGNSNTGKTSIINSYMGMDLSEEITVMANLRALPVHFVKKGIQKSVKLHLCDTAGQEKHNNTVLPALVYRHAHAGIVVFDLDDSDSLHNLDKRINAFLDYAKQEAVLFLVGNKSDLLGPDALNKSMLADSIAQDMIDDLITKHMITAYVKTSALTGKNINMLFEQLAIVLDSIYPTDTFQVVPDDHNRPVTLFQQLTTKPSWFCF